MSFPFRHKRILLIRPIEQGALVVGLIQYSALLTDFTKELVFQLARRGAYVYIWVWTIEDIAYLLDQLPDVFTPITHDVTAKNNAKSFLSLLVRLAPMDFIVKFSETKKPLSSDFIQLYGYLLGAQYRKKETIKEMNKDLGKILKKIEAKNGGLIFNLRPHDCNSSTAILIQPFKKVKKSLTKVAGGSRINSPEEESLLPQEPNSSSNIGATIGLERQEGGGIGFAIKCFGCFDCCFRGGGSSVSGFTEDIDLQIRERLRRIHLNEKSKWVGSLSNFERQEHYNNLVQEQFDGLQQLANDSL